MTFIMCSHNNNAPQLRGISYRANLPLIFFDDFSLNSISAILSACSICRRCSSCCDDLVRVSFSVDRAFRLFSTVCICFSVAFRLIFSDELGAKIGLLFEDSPKRTIQLFLCIGRRRNKLKYFCGFLTINHKAMRWVVSHETVQRPMRRPRVYPSRRAP